MDHMEKKYIIFPIKNSISLSGKINSRIQIKEYSIDNPPKGNDDSEAKQRLFYRTFNTPLRISIDSETPINQLYILLNKNKYQTKIWDIIQSIFSYWCLVARSGDFKSEQYEDLEKICDFLYNEGFHGPYSAISFIMIPLLKKKELVQIKPIRYDYVPLKSFQKMNFFHPNNFIFIESIVAIKKPEILLWAYIKLLQTEFNRIIHSRKLEVFRFSLFVTDVFMPKCKVIPYSKSKYIIEIAKVLKSIEPNITDSPMISYQISLKDINSIELQSLLKVFRFTYLPFKSNAYPLQQPIHSPPVTQLPSIPKIDVKEHSKTHNHNSMKPKENLTNPHKTEKPAPTYQQPKQSAEPITIKTVKQTTEKYNK